MEWMQDWEEFEQQGEDPGRLSGAQAQDYGNWRAMNGRNGSQEATVRENRNGGSPDFVRKVRPIWISAVVFFFIGLTFSASGEQQLEESGQRTVVSMALQDGGYFVALLLAAWAIVRTVRNRKRLPLPMAETSATTANAGWYPDGDKTDRLRYWDGSGWTDHFSEPDRSPVTDPAPDVESQRTQDVAESLRQLKSLHDEGILTDDEYESKRQSLADQL
jgi:hypothetical protein